MGLCVHKLISLDIYRDGGSVSATFTESGSDIEYCLIFKVANSPAFDSNANYCSYSHAILDVYKKSEYVSPITKLATPFFEKEERSISWVDAIKLLEGIRPHVENFQSEYLWVFEEMVGIAKRGGMASES